MQITFDTNLDGPDERNALMALLASLGGRLPAPIVQTATAAGPRVTGVIEQLADGTKGPPHGDALPSEQLLAAATRTTPTADAGELDVEGIPWDERIHSSNRAKNTDQTWRKRRGVDEVTYGQVYAELQEAGKVGIAENGAASDAGDLVPPPPSDDDEVIPPPPTEAAAESAPTAADQTSAANASDAGSAEQFADYAAFVQACSATGKQFAELNPLAQMVGVDKFPDLRNHPDKWSDFYALIS